MEIEVHGGHDSHPPGKPVASGVAEGSSLPPISHLLPSDRDWLADKAFITELTPVIAQLSQYVLGYFDADAGDAEPISVEAERALGERTAAIAANISARADRRQALGDQPLVVDEGAEDGTEPARPVTDGGRR